MTILCKKMRVKNDGITSRDTVVGYEKLFIDSVRRRKEGFSLRYQAVC